MFLTQLIPLPALTFVNMVHSRVSPTIKLLCVLNAIGYITNSIWAHVLLYLFAILKAIPVCVEI